jgi:rubredoxin
MRRHLLRPDISCPDCKKPPRLRVSADVALQHEADPPDRLIQTYQCHACGVVYDIPAAAYQSAA